MYTPFVPQFYKMTTLDPVPRPGRPRNFVTMAHLRLLQVQGKRRGFDTLHVDRLGTLERAQWTSVRRILLHSTRPPGPDQA